MREASEIALTHRVPAHDELYIVQAKSKRAKLLASDLAQLTAAEKLE